MRYSFKKIIAFSKQNNGAVHMEDEKKNDTMFDFLTYNKTLIGTIGSKHQ
jgi:hypothetical protein